jgi:hypothetical protein
MNNKPKLKVNDIVTARDGTRFVIFKIDFVDRKFPYIGYKVVENKDEKAKNEYSFILTSYSWTENGKYLLHVTEEHNLDLIMFHKPIQFETLDISTEKGIQHKMYQFYDGEPEISGWITFEKYQPADIIKAENERWNKALRGAK